MHPEEVVTVLAGTAGSLVCVANGEPTPSISWFRNGVEIRNATSVMIIERTLNESYSGNFLSSLEVFSLEPAFSGNFSCQAINPFGGQNADFQLLVDSGTSYMVFFQTHFIMMQLTPF